MKSKINRIYLIGWIFFLIHANVDAAQKNNQTCGIIPGEPLTNAYGPYDFTNPAHVPRFPIVLGAHFTPQVERLEKGATGSLIGDIAYTLRAIPNYHRALNAASRLEIRPKQPVQISSSHYSAECFFKRAIYFQPNDPTTRMLYGIHLHTLKQYKDAEALYSQALSMSPNNSEINYNIGLLYVDVGQIGLAKKHAEIAYQGGYPLLGLKNRINRAEQSQQLAN